MARGGSDASDRWSAGPVPYHRAVQPPVASEHAQPGSGSSDLATGRQPDARRSRSPVTRLIAYARAWTDGRRPPGRTAVARVALGAAIGVLAVLAKTPINTLAGGDIGYVPMLIGVGVAAWYGGFGGGLAAVGAGMLADVWLVLLPGGLLEGSDRPEQARAIFNLVVGAAATVVIAGFRESLERERTREAELQLVLRASRMASWAWDPHGGTIRWSTRSRSGDPGQPEPATFDAYLALVHPDDRARVRQGVEHTARGDGDFGLEFRARWPDGSLHWIQSSGRLFGTGRGEVPRVVGLDQDITDRRVAEEQRDALLAAERQAALRHEAFLDVASHELRTPITTIYGGAKLLARRETPLSEADRADLLMQMAAEAERLYRLVEDLLVLTRSEHGALPPVAEPVRIAPLLQRVIASEAPQWPGVRFSAEIAPDLPVVSGDDTYLEHVFRNLLSNAAKYGAPGGYVRLTASAEDGVVVVRVLDGGPGIDEADADRLFDLFYRSPSTAGLAKGAGIGLFVCRSLLTAMGGSISACRREEGGSAFTVRLPPYVEDDASDDAGGDRDAGASWSSQGELVLLAANGSRPSSSWSP